jgi:hypothetical protein
MSKLKTRGRRRTPDTSRSALARVLDAPHLAQVVPHLAPETLHQLIRHGGLDACGELVASATPEQLTTVLDLDLWRPAQTGRDEQFDADRFGEWVELLVDTGETVAARIVASLDEHLVITGLSRYVRVFDPATFIPTAPSDDELIERNVTPPGGVECEVGGYLLCAHRTDSWDAIVALLLALEADHGDCFHAVMQGCRRLSNSRPEVDGLDDLLMEPEQLLHDVTVDRENRRSRQGYSTPADARAFLQMARQRRRHRPDGTPRMNPVAAAYFRTAGDTAASDDHDASRVSRRALEPAPAAGLVAEALDAIVGLLAEAGLVPERPRALLEGTAPEPSRLTRIRPLMEHVRDTDDNAYVARSREMAFLANTLMAGCSVQSRPLTAQEASDAVVGICNVGLEHWPARWPEAEARDGAATADRGAALPDAFLVDHDLVMAFEAGWAVLHEDVSMFVAEQLIVTLEDLQCVDAETQDGLDALRRELARQRDAGTPWRARDALEVLAILDMPSWASLLGLLDECPVLPAALTATLEGRTGAVSATAFEFISTTGQIGQVRAFMRRLPDALRG